jgi:hypothetical protein
MALLSLQTLASSEITVLVEVNLLTGPVAVAVVLALLVVVVVVLPVLITLVAQVVLV